MKPWELTETLSLAEGRLVREHLIETYGNVNPEFILGAHACYDSRITYGVAKLPVVETHSEDELPWDTFKILLDELAARNLTGNAARNAVADIAARSTEAQWEHWYSRILERDFKCGVGLDTLNRVLPAADKIFKFECQLAKSLDDAELHFKGVKAVEYKLDGVRILAWVDPIKKEVILYSRQGTILVNFKHVEEQLWEQFGHQLTEPYVFDGEIVSEKFNKLMTQVNRKYNVDASDAQFHIFDVIKGDKFLEASWDVKLRDRKKLLANFFKGNKQKNLHLLTFEEINLDTEEGQKRFKALNKIALDAGFEGLMFKDLDAIYIGDRTNATIKMKPFIEVTLEVKGFKPGKGKNAKTFGSMECEGHDLGHDLKASISGMEDDMRKAIHADRENVIGQLVEIRADVISQNKKGTYSLRFPRFLRFRGFVPGEKL